MSFTSCGIAALKVQFHRYKIFIITLSSLAPPIPSISSTSGVGGVHEGMTKRSVKQLLMQTIILASSQKWAGFK